MSRTRVAGCAATLLLLISTGGWRAAAQDDDFDFATMAEDIEVMQRVLGKALAEHYSAGRPLANAAALNAWKRLATGRPPAEGKGDQDAASTMRLYGLATQYMTQTALHTPNLNIAGYYVPGVGVVFTLDLPVATKKVDVEPAETPKSDLWDQSEGELRGATSNETLWFAGQAKKRAIALDDEALDKAVGVLIKTVGRYGSRIEQLSQGESIIIAARVSGRTTLASNDRNLIATYNLVTGWAGQGGLSERLIVNVPVAALRSFAGGKLDRSELRERAEITRYRAPAAKPALRWGRSSGAE